MVLLILVYSLPFRIVLLTNSTIRLLTSAPQI